MKDYLRYLITNDDKVLLAFKTDANDMYGSPMIIKWMHSLNGSHFFEARPFEGTIYSNRTTKDILDIYHIQNSHIKIFDEGDIKGIRRIAEVIQAEEKIKNPSKSDTHWTGENADVFADFISSKGKYVCLCESIHKQPEYYLIDYIDDQNFLIWNVNNFGHAAKTNRKSIYDTIRPVTKGYALWIYDSSLKERIPSFLKRINPPSHPTGDAGVSSIPVGGYNAGAAMIGHSTGVTSYSGSGNILIHTGNSNNVAIGYSPSGVTLRPVLPDDAYVGAEKKVVLISTDTEKPITIKRPKLLQL